ncbi:hypothetical protein [Amycolatopsis coloradensis]|uniref:hypothetical protein n=1 Tax=Amycolatopsis coloradensis TaxID=76021 RepID=UPI001ABF3017|nr:hypothetical protein [Amycolatopsis coloradensis]
MPVLSRRAGLALPVPLRRGRRGTYHTGRFTKIPRLAKTPRVQTLADRGSGQP